jgi:hypothetical protein
MAIGEEKPTGTYRIYVDNVGHLTLYGEFIRNGIKYDLFLIEFKNWDEFFLLVETVLPNAMDEDLMNHLHIYSK